MKIQLTTTFKQLRDRGACKGRCRHLAKALGGVGKYGRTKPINLLTILEHNGCDDFFWTLGIIEDHQVLRAMAADFAESVLPIFEGQYPDDRRPREAIEVVRRYAHGEATGRERAAARDAAWAAAWAAARDAAWDAARDAARDVAWAAAWAAARAAAWAAARDAARDVEREKQVEIIKRYLK